MRKFMIGAVAVASIVGGSAAVAAVNPLVIAGAQNDPATSAPPPPTTAAGQPQAPTDKGEPGVGDRHRGPRGGHGGTNPLKQTLDELVANGTITQAQADAITSSLKAKLGDGHGSGDQPGGHGPGGPGGRGAGFDLFKKDVLTAAAAAIGIDPEALRTEMRGGSSLGAAATAHGVDPQKVVDAIVATAITNIDKAVASGKLSAERAAMLKEKLPEHAKRLVARAPGAHGHEGGGGPGQPGASGDGKHGDQEDKGDKGGEPGEQDDQADEGPSAPTSEAPAPTTKAPTTEAPATTQAPTTAAPSTTDAPATSGTTGS